jgi:hypothetical protein
LEKDPEKNEKNQIRGKVHEVGSGKCSVEKRKKNYLIYKDGGREQKRTKGRRDESGQRIGKNTK